MVISRTATTAPNPGRHNPVPSIGNLIAHTGGSSALLGTYFTDPNNPPNEPFGDSSLSQVVTVPANAPSTLSFWYFPASTSTTDGNEDEQVCQVLDSTGVTVLATLLYDLSDAETWTQVTYNMTAFAGQQVMIYFDVWEDGYGDPSYMSVDDVSLFAGSSPFTPTVTATATPSLTSVPTLRPSFTPRNTETPTATSTATPTYTMTSTATATPTPTSTSTITPTSTLTITSTPANTQTSTITPTPTKALRATRTFTPSATPTVSATPTASNTPGGSEGSLVGLGGNGLGPDANRSRSVVALPNISQNGAPINFTFTLGAPASAQLSLYDLSGEQVYSTKVYGNEGENRITWQLQNLSGSSVSSGLYVYTIQVSGTLDTYTRIGKVIVLHRR